MLLSSSSRFKDERSVIHQQFFNFNDLIFSSDSENFRNRLTRIIRVVTTAFDNFQRVRNSPIARNDLRWLLVYRAAGILQSRTIQSSTTFDIFLISLQTDLNDFQSRAGENSPEREDFDIIFFRFLLIDRVKNFERAE